MGEASEFLKIQEEKLHEIERSLLGRVEEVLPVDHDVMTVTELLQVCRPLHTISLGLIHHEEEIRETGDDDIIPSLRETSKSDGTRISHLKTKVEAGKNDCASTCHEPELACEDSFGRLSIPNSCKTSQSQDSRYVHSFCCYREYVTVNSSFCTLFGRASTADSRDTVEESQLSQSMTFDLVEAWRSRQSMMSASSSELSPDGGAHASHEDDGLRINESAQLIFHSPVEKERFCFTLRHSTDEDSVVESLAPTIKGRGFFEKRALEQQKQKLYHELTDPRNHSNFSPCAPMSEVVVNDDVKKCSVHQDVTLDQSLMSDVLIESPNRSRLIGVGDESLLVTPVLARYRLEPDDSSIGVKVVPIKLRNHRTRAEALLQSNKDGHVQKKNESVSRMTGSQEGGEKRDGRSEKRHHHRIAGTLSPNVSVRTPFKVRNMGYEDTEFEQKFRGKFLPLNESESDPSNETPAQHDHRNVSPLNSKPFLDVLVPPERWIDFQGMNASAEASHRTSRRRQTADSAVKVDFLGGQESGIAIVAQNEYDSAPSVVRMQIGFDEVNGAIRALNSWFDIRSNDMEDDPRLDESDACRILRIPQRQGKILLMSLCHWRRMNMYTDEETKALYFLPNTKRIPRLTI